MPKIENTTRSYSQYRPCEITKAKSNMTETMLDRRLLEPWKLWRQTESEKEMEGTYKKKDTRETYKKKFKKGDTAKVFKHCLGKVCSFFIKKWC